MTWTNFTRENTSKDLAGEPRVTSGAGHGTKVTGLFSGIDRIDLLSQANRVEIETLIPADSRKPQDGARF